jgi:hypothetical protein
MSILKSIKTNTCLIFLIFLFMLLGSFLVKSPIFADTFSCGVQYGQINCKGAGAYDAHFCKPGEKEFENWVAGVVSADCCPGSSFERGEGGPVPARVCCAKNNIATGNWIYAPLCCPDGTTPKHAAGALANACLNSSGADVCVPFSTVCSSLDLKRLETLRDECNKDDCYYFAFGFANHQNLCFYNNTVKLDETPRRMCSNGSLKVVPNTCGDGTCDTTLNEKVTCPADCGGGGVPGSGTIFPTQPICEDMCKKKVSNAAGGFTYQDEDPKDPEYADYVKNCCSCVCVVDTVGPHAGEPDPTCKGILSAVNVWTEIGCITSTQNGITVAAMRIFVGIVTGLSIVRFIQAGMMYNSDSPEKIKEARSIGLSALAALVFGVSLPIILNFIGIKVFGFTQVIVDVFR